MLIDENHHCLYSQLYQKLTFQKKISIFISYLLQFLFIFFKVDTQEASEWRVGNGSILTNNVYLGELVDGERELQMQGSFHFNLFTCDWGGLYFVGVTNGSFILNFSLDLLY